MSNYTYILECDDHSLYTGWTNDLTKRYETHLAGKGGKYTHAHKPIRMVFYEESDTKEEAMSKEAKYKLLSTDEKWELIASPKNVLRNELCLGFYSLNRFIRDNYGRKLYKIAIDAGFTCPNRDGTISEGGCIFCSGAGSGDFTDSTLSITEQIEEGKKLVRKKLSTKDGEEPSCIAYFQAYTNTYDRIDVLRQRYMEAINHPDVAVLSIATRPDCIDDDVIELIRELNEIKPIWVELGLQTIRDDIAQYINRGYETSVYEKTMSKLSKLKLQQIITHVIIGLPGESGKDMLKTVDYAVRMGTTGIKLQLLHVIYGTELERQYLEEKFRTLSMEEYTDIVIDCLRLLPPDVVVHRLTGDGNKKTLVSPLWSGDKKRVMNYMKKRIHEELCYANDEDAHM